MVECMPPQIYEKGRAFYLEVDLKASVPIHVCMNTSI